MTIRDYFDRKKRRLVIVAFTGWAGFAGGIGLTVVVGSYALLLTVPCFVIFAVTLAYGFDYSFRCPRCGGPWRGLAMQNSRSMLRLDPRIRFCPFCGVDIDAKDSFEPAPESMDLLA